ncbi:MAG: glycosyl transferase family 2 [Armatimonadetes bacterium]|jgi:glycosyltransferase involved in cell wall biosynthesis|nr:glycosyl transferase family 2 [Armatimonadota bacterium]
MTPRLSLLIPVRNAAATLDEALASIAAQTLEDWEAILVEDGSTDETPELLVDWARRDRRFRVLRNGEPLGLVASLNRAAAAATAPLLARMDADDLSLPSRLERQVERIEHGDVAAVGCRIRYFPEELVADGARRYASWLNSLVTAEEHARDIFIECPLAHPTLLLRADALRAVGGYREMGWPEDYDLLLRLWESGYRMCKLPEVLVHWREGPGRTSRTHPHYSLDALIRCRAHFLYRAYFRDRPALIFGSGPVGKALARALLAEGAKLVAFVDVDPRKVGQTVHGVRVLPREEALALRGQFFGLAAMGRPEAREALRGLLLGAGWDEGVDFRCVS